MKTIQQKSRHCTPGFDPGSSGNPCMPKMKELEWITCIKQVMTKGAHVMTMLAFAMLISFSHAQAGETFDRVMKERTLRCAYTIYPPFFIKDPNSGEFTGIYYEITEAMGKELSIKIDWTEEVGSDAILQGLHSGRYDAVCPGYFMTPSRANGADSLKPILYIPNNIYVRADETRFANFSDLNKPEIKMGTMDGEYSSILQATRFPETQPVSLMGLSSPAERFELVATGKADFTVAEAATAEEYREHNPGKLKRFGTPVSVTGSTILIPRDEYPLAAFLNAGIDSLILSGKLVQIRDKYEEYPNTLLLPSRPYEDSK